MPVFVLFTLILLLFYGKSRYGASEALYSSVGIWWPREWTRGRVGWRERERARVRNGDE